LLSRENITDLAQLDGKTIAYNESLSQSGWAAPISFLSKHAIAPKAAVKTGAHINSMRAVLSGTADFCGVDAQTFALICNMTDDFNDLRILAHTEPTPGLPYICALRFDPKEVADAVLRAYETLDGADKSSLRLKGFVHIDTEHYFSVPSPTSPDKMFD
jgi:ABC-type phosphate/phosphonate transport system substrate-binding protein